MNNLLTLYCTECYINSVQALEITMSQLTLNQRLATLQPQVDLHLFESSLDYRNKILCLLAEQEQTLASINKEFGQQQPSSFGSERKFVLGYN